METENSEYIFEKLDESRIDDLIYLFKEVFHSIPPKDEITEKHLYCHGDHKFVGYIAYDKVTHKPAAYHGVFPVYIVYDGKKHLIAQSGDIMTHPDHQKKGLFAQLAKKTYEFCTQNGIDVIFAFPNSVSYPLFIKALGFSDTKKLLNFTLYENKFELCRVTEKNKLLAKIHYTYFKFIISFFKKGKPFQNSNSKAVDFAYILHDDDYFRLKTSKYKFFIKIKGVTVWLSISQNQIALGDIDLIHPEKIASVIKILKRITFLTGYRFLTVGGSEKSPLIVELVKLNYTSIPSYQPIFLNLNSTIPHDKYLFLNSDVDVF